MAYVNAGYWPPDYVEGEAADVSAVGIASAEAFGVPTVTSVAAGNVVAIGIPSGEAFGVPTVQAVAQSDVVAIGIASQEAFGTPSVSSVGDTPDDTPLSNQEMRQMYEWVRELALINGLVDGYPVTVQKTRRIVGGIEQSITGAGGSTVVVARV